jgi:hypothetical protein
MEHMDFARALLENSKRLWKRPFKNGDILKSAIEELIKQLRKLLYEEVTVEEIAAINAAMVSGPAGMLLTLATGTIVNDHPVSSCFSTSSFPRCY